MKSSSNRILVALEANPYEVVIGGKGLKAIGDELLRAGIKYGSKILIVTNPDVANPYSEACLKSLECSGFIPILKVIEAGEDQKTFNNVTRIHDAAYEAKLERGSAMMALGGGVIGDITGFAAATWLRGIDVIQVPTTLLAMVDAAIGGKTGVNHPKGKNLIGAFHQPKLVLIDPLTLSTLPIREFRAGIAEVIKYGVIGDPSIFNLLKELPEINNQEEMNTDVLKQIIKKSVAIKARVVALDEKEKGLRAILNYGHTFGHVLENLSGYGTLLHGEAVGLGMIAIGELAVQCNFWSQQESELQKELIAKMDLPTIWPKFEFDQIMHSLHGDKKVENGKVRFVVPKKIGEVEIRNDITEQQIRTCMERLIN